MSKDFIVIKGARQHNLKNIDVKIPRDKLVVITGISGSGKSSLAFDTIYAEGQRRYVESLSAYARQFLGQMDKPDVDYIEGLSPAIAIDQKSGSKNPRSTVGTVTEIYDYLRLLFARIGKPHCPKCGLPITQQTVQQIVDQVMSLEKGTRVQVLAPVIRGKKGEHKKVLDDIRKEGFTRVRVNGEVFRVDEDIQLDRYKMHTVEIVVDRLAIRDGIEQRLADSIELAMRHSSGIVVINVVDKEDLVFSERFACPECGISFEELTPRMFSFNSPYGACPECAGLGSKEEIDPELVLDLDKSIMEGALIPWRRSFDGTRSDFFANRVVKVCERFGIDINVPVRSLPPEHLDILLYGVGNERFKFGYHNFAGDWVLREAGYDGLIPYLERKYNEVRTQGVRDEIEDFITTRTCPSCKGARLRPESLAVTVGGKSIMEITALSCKDARDFFDNLQLTERERAIAAQILKEIRERLGFLVNVGLDYLTLDRSAGTLAGGEAQRIRLATQIGSSLVGVLYILDEPSIGLHQRDNNRLISTLKSLRDLGNTVIVVEHDEETIRSADHIIDVGPGAGAEGGYVVASGTVEEIMSCKDSVTGRYLSGKEKIPVPVQRRTGNGKSLLIRGAREHNLKGIDVEIPLGLFVCVTGVSGSGKSTLINEILYKRLAHELNRAGDKPGAHDGLVGIEHLDRVINVDQSPIGRTPRSNPATYTGTFDFIRQTFALTPEARARGYRPGRFSFNVKGGRCEACRGDGIIKIEMHFLPDVYVPCEVCRGKRYNRETLEVKYKGKTIADVLDMRVDEALEFFRNIPRIRRKLETLYDVGLGYIKLGQPATTLSGGEAQRVKLATELSRRSNGRTLYILDEPTTGLHFADIHKLLDVLGRLVDDGDTVLVIEHNLDVIKTADYIIDLGPEGGERGGRIVACGTPEEVAQVDASYTGQFLRKVLY
ncbi:MAG: excinuclease ABC subunit UvrA [Bacillota bacterium]|nr:excinuclease ABC subunit UvrA [Bacillota bacterium]HOJ56964.1 excinuclease ABC subunit UvrA [Bacillota bacterium]HOL01732.1 excinuclease ABC subunit UvrA [Bacillota bacterium]HPO79990.1 excinuclease ABC subunit UvrA [Bacillota bacterium]HPZ91525.1 excinuclease ABC subunit UvrA [Bacillota bacterium]